jgi:hypothetical protein
MHFHGGQARLPELGTAFPGNGKCKSGPGREWERLDGIHELHNRRHLFMMLLGESHKTSKGRKYK